MAHHSFWNRNDFGRLPVFVGYKTKWAAMVLMAVLTPITLTVQVGQITTLGPLFKNIAILVGLLFFILNDTNNFLK